MRILLFLLLLTVSWSGAEARKRIAFTFDDVPRGRGAFFTPDERTIRLIAGLHQAGVKQAAFYVVPGQVGHDDGLGGEQRILAVVDDPQMRLHVGTRHRLGRWLDGPE